MAFVAVLKLKSSFLLNCSLRKLLSTYEKWSYTLGKWLEISAFCPEIWRYESSNRYETFNRYFAGVRKHYIQPMIKHLFNGLVPRKPLPVNLFMPVLEPALVLYNTKLSGSLNNDKKQKKSLLGCSAASISQNGNFSGSLKIHHPSILYLGYLRSVIGNYPHA